MWSKYKFYIIGAGILVFGIVAYNKWGRKSSPLEEEAKDPASKLVNSGKTVGDAVALSRALNYVR